MVIIIINLARLFREKLTKFSIYIHESMVYPTAYVVAGYNPVMPQDFRERLSDRELGDIIAYLLSSDAK
jgi:hypothetical protein